MYIFRNYGDLFGGLFTPKTKGDRILFKIGAISGLLLAFAPLVEHVERWNKLIFQILVGLIVVCVVLFFATFTLLAIRQVGREAGKSNFLTQSLYFFKNLFLFLPCLLITIVILLWAYLTKQPVFNSK